MPRTKCVITLEAITCSSILEISAFLKLASIGAGKNVPLATSSRIGRADLVGAMAVGHDHCRLRYREAKAVTGSTAGQINPFPPGHQLEHARRPSSPVGPSRHFNRRSTRGSEFRRSCADLSLQTYADCRTRCEGTKDGNVDRNRSRRTARTHQRSCSENSTNAGSD